MPSLLDQYFFAPACLFYTSEVNVIVVLFPCLWTDGLFSSVQCHSIQLQAGAIWRQAVTATVTALHCSFVCLFGSFVYCLTELFLLGISLKIILLAGLVLFFGVLFRIKVLTVPVGALGML